MQPPPGDNSTATAELLDRAGQGDRTALGELLARHEARLRVLVSLRLDRRLQRRIDAADVLQDTYLEAASRFGDFLRDQPMPFYLWLRFLTVQKVHLLHRQHLGTQARDAGRELSLQQGVSTENSSAILAEQLVGQHTTPSQAAIRAEQELRLQEALDRMDPLDREVLVLRHFEQLSNVETARVLGVSEGASSRRYGRALL